MKKYEGVCRPRIEREEEDCQQDCEESMEGEEEEEQDENLFHLKDRKCHVDLSVRVLHKRPLPGPQLPCILRASLERM